MLREACCVLRREFIQIGNIDLFLESVTIASACNKMMGKRFLKPNTIDLILSGGYTRIVNYSNKAIMWLVCREQTDGCRIRHARTNASIDLPNFPASLWTVPALKRELSMSSSVACITVIPVYPIVTSLPWEATL